MANLPVNFAAFLPEAQVRLMHPCKQFILACLWGLLGIVLIIFLVIENVGKITSVTSYRNGLTGLLLTTDAVIGNVSGNVK